MPAQTALVSELMKLCGPQVEHRRVLEVTDGEPLLAEPLGSVSARGYTAVTTGSFDVRVLSSRFPGFTFRSGSAEDCLSSGEQFDRIVAATPLLDPVSARQIPALIGYLRKGGVFFARAADDSDWTSCDAIHHRLGLRIVDRIPVGSGASLLVSRRR